MEGDPPNDKCYVVLTGRCAVFRNATMFDVKIEDAMLKKIDETLLPSPHITNALFQGEDRKLMRKLLYYGDMLATKGFGTLFGETGLLNNNKRNASIVALENCELMVFHKSALDLIKASYSKDIGEKKEFMISVIPEMGLIGNHLRLTQLIEYFKPKRFKKGQCLTIEGQANNKIYIVEEGEVLFSKVLMLPEIENNRSIKYRPRGVLITTLQGKGIVGEDCLDSGGTYKYTTTVKSSNLKVYVCEKNMGYSELSAFPLFSILLKGYHLKEYS